MKPVSGLLKISLCLLGGWVAALAVILILPVPAVFILLTPLSVLVGLASLTLAVMSLGRGRDNVLSGLAILLVIVTWWLAMAKGLEWGAWAHFRLYRGWYEAKVARVLAAGDKAERERICGDDCLAGDSARVSFHYMHGFLNWHDIVYEPTGAEMRRGERGHEDIYFRGVTHLSGHWYLVHEGD